MCEDEVWLGYYSLNAQLSAKLFQIAPPAALKRLPRQQSNYFSHLGAPPTL